LASDGIFAVSAYCPITNLDHTDAAYEWLFNGVNDYKKMVFGKREDGGMDRKKLKGKLTSDQINVSDRLKKLFPEYINSLTPKKEDDS